MDNKTALNQVHAMCVQSLSPEDFEKWEKVSKELIDTRTDLKAEIQLPSALQPNQVCYLKFRKDDAKIIATVRGVHFYIGKVKYDLGLWLGDGSVDNPEYETRIYNVDSAFLTPA